MHAACAVPDDMVPADAGAAKTLPIPSTRIAKIVAIRRVLVIIVSLSDDGSILADHERPEVISQISGGHGKDHSGAASGDVDDAVPAEWQDNG
ncbi:hypothetical protein [Amycolatopsis sp. NPDC102389]|uniref:hypothetical protein n=1 Tax=Amycolatopsis sp. NPDC102389 TaxID=3363941 RepID=UPI003822233A